VLNIFGHHICFQSTYSYFHKKTQREFWEVLFLAQYFRLTKTNKGQVFDIFLRSKYCRTSSNLSQNQISYYLKSTFSLNRLGRQNRYSEGSMPPVDPGLICVKSGLLIFGLVIHFSLLLHLACWKIGHVFFVLIFFRPDEFWPIVPIPLLKIIVVHVFNYFSSFKIKIFAWEIEIRVNCKSSVWCLFKI
jgi:hypothetical protein